MKIYDLRDQKIKVISTFKLNFIAPEYYTVINNMQSREELEGDELCNNCPLDEDLKGAHCYGGPVIMCEGSHCKEAYEQYVDNFEEEESNE